MNKFIFDVDGTLTPSRGTIDQRFHDYFLQFCEDNPVILITGSDYAKTVEQLGIDICMAVEKVYNSSGNDVWSKGVNIKSSSWILPPEPRYWLETLLSVSKFGMRTGNHIEERPGSANFSIVGRNATKKQRETYIEWDRQKRERELISIEFNHKFKDVEARIGGETGIDIYQKGHDKGQIVADFDPTDRLYFFGDRMEPGGNDFPLKQMIESNNRGMAYEVKGWSDTYERLCYIQEARIAA